jgi:hypothetical protein
MLIPDDLLLFTSMDNLWQWCSSDWCGADLCLEDFRSGLRGLLTCWMACCRFIL